MAYTPPPEIQQLQAQMNQDPRVQQAFQVYQANKNQQNFSAYLEAVKPYLAHVDQNQFGIDPATGQINHTSNYGHPWILAGGMAAGAAPYLAIPGAAAAPAATAPGAAAVGAFPGSELPEMAGATVGGGAASTAGIGSKIWSALGGLGGVIGLGTNVLGGILNQRAIGKATDQEVAAANRALDLQRDIFDTSQRNLNPYMQTGAGASGRLNYLMGGTGNFNDMTHPTTAGGAAPSITAGAQPLPPNSGGWTSMMPGSPIVPAQSTMVNMQAPDGSVKAVPSGEVPHWTQLGARMVS